MNIPYPKTEIRRSWVDFLEEQEFKPESLVTLTFSCETISDRRAYFAFKKWLHEINKYVEGEKYKRRWKHCYFSYFVVGEREKRLTVTYHVLIDNWFPWRYAARYWWNFMGYIDIRRVNNVSAALRYVAKFFDEDGLEPILWQTKKRWRGFKPDINDKRLDKFMEDAIPESAYQPKGFGKKEK